MLRIRRDYNSQDMSTREQIHALIDELPDSELGPLAEILASRRANGTGDDPLLDAIANASEDDEPLTREDEQAISEGQADIANGRLKSLQDIKRELGYEPA